jgi:hypothetical protein
VKVGKNFGEEKEFFANEENKLLVSSFDGFPPPQKKLIVRGPNKAYEWSCSKRHIRPSPPAAMD